MIYFKNKARSPKTTLHLENLNFFKNLSSGLKLFVNLLKQTKMFTKLLTRAPRYILIQSFFLAIIHTSF